MIIRGKYTVIECDKGKSIDKFAEELLHYVTFHDEKVLGVFNLVYFEVKKGMNVYNIIDTWSYERENR